MSLLGATLRLLGADVRALDVAVVDAAGAHVPGFDGSRPASATLTNVTVTTTSTILKASNPARRRLIIHNDSNGRLLVAFASVATATAFTVEIGGNNTYEGPLNDYTGDVSAIRASGSSTVRVTEVTT